MDQVSLLGAAIEYMGYLQERVRTLEEQAANKAVKARKTEEEDVSGEQMLPEVRARICNKTILVKIGCGKRKGILGRILGEMEKLNLAVVNLSVAPFGSLAFDITLIAKMEKELSVTTTEVVTGLRSALQAVY